MILSVKKIGGVFNAAYFLLYLQKILYNEKVICNHSSIDVFAAYPGSGVECYQS